MICSKSLTWQDDKLVCLFYSYFYKQKRSGLSSCTSNDWQSFHLMNRCMMINCKRTTWHDRFAKIALCVGCINVTFSHFTKDFTYGIILPYPYFNRFADIKEYIWKNRCCLILRLRGPIELALTLFEKHHIIKLSFL